MMILYFKENNAEAKTSIIVPSRLHLSHFGGKLHCTSVEKEILSQRN